ncbi:MAG: hypothetical protein HYY25_10225 [Candidatus Wallbacteria bacterium]|nr:hypothetical protein [Candidatus Wallbacteria bacterium]
MIHSRWRRVLWLALALSGAGAASLLADAPAGVVPDRFAMSLGAGEKVNLRFVLQEPASVRITAHDADHAPVCTVLADSPRPAGENAVTFDGHASDGRQLPRGVYYFVLRAESRSGVMEHDPGALSGGESVPVEFGEYGYNRASRRLEFRLAKDAAVRVRAGIHGGPLLATPLDWQPTAAGPHSIPWDGRDEDGLVDLAAHPKFSLVFEAFALPAGSVTITDGPEPEPTTAKASELLQRRAALRKAALARGRIDPQYLSRAGYRTSPRFTLTASSAKGEAGPLEATGVVPLTVKLDESSLQRMLEQRFEIVTFVDFQRIAEEEQGYSPYTVEVPMAGLPEGEHVVSVSVVTLTDQSATKSIRVNVKLPARAP